MNYQIVLWAQRHGVNQLALQELQTLFIAVPEDAPLPTGNKSETAVQNDIRLSTAKMGWRLWRNNVGVLRDERGVPVRYGLANDSTKLNKVVKSGDLIGIKPTLVTPEMVGSLIGQFVSIEVKHQAWSYKGTEHEQAQLKWQQIVNGLGGYAKFANSVENL